MSEIEINDAVGAFALAVALLALLFAVADFFLIVRMSRKPEAPEPGRCTRCGWVNSPGLIACKQCRRELAARSKN